MRNSELWINQSMEVAYEFFDDAFVDENRKSDTEDTNEKKIATTPTEIVFKILSSSSPIFNVFVFLCFHSSTHFR